MAILARSLLGVNKSSSDFPSRASKALVIVFMVAILKFGMVLGAQHTVGDSGGWGLGNDLQSWSTQLKFHVGDELYFPYPSGQHSVLMVSEEDYKSCNKEKPISSDNGMGNMVMPLMSEETYYFICGVPGHCEQGLRLSVTVEHEAVVDGKSNNVRQNSSSAKLNFSSLAYMMATIIFSMTCTFVLG
ncbi:hypothetical protein L7F22_063115 [Adiantum nelumboides]|nr:hypothetical protein [Adiantum nelumboides]